MFKRETSPKEKAHQLFVKYGLELARATAWKNMNSHPLTSQSHKYWAQIVRELNTKAKVGRPMNRAQRRKLKEQRKAARTLHPCPQNQSQSQQHP